MYINMPDRPTSSKSYKDAYVKENFPDGALKVIAGMVETMKSYKQNTLSTNHWALDAFSHHPWRKAQKNQLRDFISFAMAAYFEESFVKDYRRKMFKASRNAVYLRSHLLVCLSPFVKIRQVIHKGVLVKQTLFVYPDNCPHSTSSKRHKVDVDAIIASNHEVSYITKARKTIQSLKKSLANNYYAKLVPGDPNPNRDVARCITELSKVRHITFPSSFFFSLLIYGCSLQALHKNAHVLQKMEASGLKPSEIDPDDEEFAVNAEDIYGLPDSSDDADAESDPDAVPKKPVRAAVVAVRKPAERAIPLPSHQNDSQIAEKEKSDDQIIADNGPPVQDVTAQTPVIQQPMDIELQTAQPVETDAQNTMDPNGNDRV